MIGLLSVRIQGAYCEISFKFAKTNKTPIYLRRSNKLIFAFVFLYGNNFFSQESKSLFTPSKNIVKVGINEIFYGDVGFYYERVFSKKVAIEIGSGLVFRNFFKNFFQEVPQSDKMLIGTSFNLKCKYYPYIPGESLYFSSDFKFRRYRTQYSTTSISGNNTLTLNEFEQRSIFRFGLGFIQCVDQHFTIDYYTSIGLNGVLNQNIVPQYDQTTNDFTYLKDQFKDVLLHFTAGVKFGYRF